MMHPLILGSQSEARKRILNYFSLPFVQIPSHFAEESIPFLGDPKQYAQSLALKKAEALCKQYPDRLVLTADTVVSFNNKVYNKPVDKEHAHAMLKDLGGHCHNVITAVAVRLNDKIASECEETKVCFFPLSDEQIALYHQSCYCLDKAGGYAIQKGGSLIISKIDGSYDNVMGLPLNATRLLLLQFGIDLWDYLNPF